MPSAQRLLPTDASSHPGFPRFVAAVRAVWQRRRAEMEQRKGECVAVRAQPDWFWTVLVQSFCTNGRSSNLDRKRRLYPHAFRWEGVVALSYAERSQLFEALPNGHRRSQLAPALESAFRRVLEAGGAAAMGKLYEAQPTAEARHAFLRSFAGIGEKYARNIPLDIYDETLLEHVAIDKRLRNVLDQIEPTLPKAYRAREAYLLAVGAAAGLPDGWSIDRLVYFFGSEILEELPRAEVVTG